MARSGGDDGNRTRVTSLEDWGSTIELHPHGRQAALRKSTRNFFTARFGPLMKLARPQG